MLWINEGIVLDDAGNMVTTSFIDLREKEERTAIGSFVKGCKRDHALEDGETMLLSKPARFREYRVALIRDEQEGFAKEEIVTVEGESPEEAAKQRATADLNEALELVGSSMKSARRVAHSRRRTKSESVSHGEDWCLNRRSTFTPDWSGQYYTPNNNTTAADVLPIDSRDPASGETGRDPVAQTAPFHMECTRLPKALVLPEHGFDDDLERRIARRWRATLAPSGRGERLAGTGPPLGKVTVSAPPTILQMRSPRCRQWTRKRLRPDGNTRTPKPRVRGRGCSRGRSR